jgi:cyclic pyranopterin phosphate synthase
MPEFTHIDSQGRVRMVDVSQKAPSLRTAVAGGYVTMKADTLAKIQSHSVKKGNVLETARIAGVMAAKQTAALVPMCHPLHITHVKVDFAPDERRGHIGIEATVRAIDHTGVEMEALTAVSVAALTVYDMCKSYDRDMTITHIGLLKKSGGKSGDYERSGPLTEGTGRHSGKNK